MGALLFCAALLSFVTGMFSITYRVDYVDHVYKAFAKALPETCVRVDLSSSTVAVGFRPDKFADTARDYFAAGLKDYEGSYRLSLKFYQHAAYPGTSEYPTAVSVGLICEITPLVTYSEVTDFYIRSKNG